MGIFGRIFAPLAPKAPPSPPSLRAELAAAMRPRSPVPLFPGEVCRAVLGGVSLWELRVVGQTFASVQAPADMHLNGIPIPVHATAGKAVPKVQDCELGRGVLVVTDRRCVFVSPTYGLSVAWGEMLSAFATAGDVTVVRSGVPPFRLVGDGLAIGKAMRGARAG